MNIIILMAGASEDFAEKGHTYPKYILELQHRPMIQRIIESLENIGEKILCIIKKEDQEKYFLGDTVKMLCNNAQCIEIPSNTKGAVCSALFAIDKINSSEELLIVNGDQFVKHGIEKAIEHFRERNLDGGLVCFEAVHPKYSSILVGSDNFVIQTSEKKPISNIASTGIAYYKSGHDFIKSSFKVIENNVNTNGNYYVSSTFNEMILEHKKIGIFTIPKKDYISFATYQLYENYLSGKRSA